MERKNALKPMLFVKLLLKINPLLRIYLLTGLMIYNQKNQLNQLNGKPQQIGQLVISGKLVVLQWDLSMSKRVKSGGFGAIGVSFVLLLLISISIQDKTIQMLMIVIGQVD